MFKTWTLLFFVFCSTLFANVKDKEQKEITCLSQAIYYEARGESFEGKIAVGNVVLNRYASGNYASVCAVIHKKGQFIWAANPQLISEKKSWIKCVELAEHLYYGEIGDNTNGSTYFKEKSSTKRWSDRLIHTVSIGKHNFYRDLVYNTSTNYSSYYNEKYGE